jgi:hypothetical protein
VSLINALLQELRDLINETRSMVAAAVNASMTMLYWRIGKRIHETCSGKNAPRMANN